MLTHHISKRWQLAPLKRFGWALRRHSDVLSGAAAMLCLVLMAVELVIASTEYNQLITLPTNRAPAPAGGSSRRSAAPTRCPRAGGPQSPPASTPHFTRDHARSAWARGPGGGEALGTTPPGPPGTHLGPKPGSQAALSRRTRRVHLAWHGQRAALQRAPAPPGPGPPTPGGSRERPAGRLHLCRRVRLPASAAPQPPAPPRASSRFPSLLLSPALSPAAPTALTPRRPDDFSPVPSPNPRAGSLPRAPRSSERPSDSGRGRGEPTALGTPRGGGRAGTRAGGGGAGERAGGPWREGRGQETNAQLLRKFLYLLTLEGLRAPSPLLLPKKPHDPTFPAHPH